MLPNFQIIGFRGFRHLTLDRLGRVNLVVGRNNVGKSSLLEAINLYALDGSPAALVNLLVRREQMRTIRDTDNLEVLESAFLAALRLFFGGGSTPGKVTPIRMGSIGAPEREVSIDVEWRGMAPQSDQNMPTPGNEGSNDLGPRLAIKSQVFGQNSLALANLLGDMTARNVARWHMERRLRSKAPDPILITPNGVPGTSLGMWWRDITLTPMEDVVLEALRIVEPALERVSVVTGDSSPQDVTVLALLKGETRPVPLTSLGDGMNRVLGIVLALIKAKGGVLLIDEVENGLHYSIQTDLWRLILRTAEQLDVQVFATSHSWDSIAAFQEASAENQAVQGYLIRLLRKDGDVIANILDERKLGIATRQDIEVR